MRVCSLILCAVVSGLVLMSSCGGRRSIPNETLSEMYAEMYMLDQSVSHIAKSNEFHNQYQVYEPVLVRYGYSLDEYDRTVKILLNDPQQLVKIFERTNEILMKRKYLVEKRISDAKALETGHSILDSLRLLARDSVTSSVQLRLIDIITFREDTSRRANYVEFYDSTEPVHIRSAIELYDFNPFAFDTNFRAPLRPLTRKEFDSIKVAATDSVFSDTPVDTIAKKPQTKSTKKFRLGENLKNMNKR